MPVTESAVLEAMSAVWDEAHEAESEWGMPMKSALQLLARKLGIELLYFDLIQAKHEDLDHAGPGLY